MASRVFLHVGLPKTGTTFLQTAMWANRRRLREQGILYPGTNRFDHFHALQHVRGKDERHGGAHAGAWDRLAEELGSWDGVGLVSHEFFCMATRRQRHLVVQGLQPAEVHVVVTARAYPLQFPAIWQEALKMTYDGGLDQFMEEAFAGKRQGAWGWSSQDLPVILRRWSKVVPPARIHVVTAPPPGSPRELLWERWCQTLGIDDTGFDLDVSLPNQSLGAEQAALLLRVKPFLSGPLLDGPTRHRWVRRYFGHEVLVPQAGSRFAPSAEYADELRRRSDAAISKIRKRGYDVVGDLNDLAADAPAMNGPHPDRVGDKELLDVAARAIDQMINDMREMTLQRNEWRDRARSLARANEALARTPWSRIRGRAGRLARRLRGGPSGGPPDE